MTIFDFNVPQQIQKQVKKCRYQVSSREIGVDKDIQSDDMLKVEHIKFRIEANV